MQGSRSMAGSIVLQHAFHSRLWIVWEIDDGESRTFDLAVPGRGKRHGPVYPGAPVLERQVPEPCPPPHAARGSPGPVPLGAGRHGPAGNGVPAGFVFLVFAWSLILPLLGIVQDRLLPGVWHWTVQAAHLVAGGAAIGLGQVLVRRIAVLREGGTR